MMGNASFIVFFASGSNIYGDFLCLAKKAGEGMKDKKLIRKKLKNRRNF
jgi:hypothetical protein